MSRHSPWNRTRKGARGRWPLAGRAERGQEGCEAARRFPLPAPVSVRLPTGSLFHVQAPRGEEKSSAHRKVFQKNISGKLRNTGYPMKEIKLSTCANSMDTPGMVVTFDARCPSIVISFPPRGNRPRNGGLKTEWGCGTAATAADCKSAPSGFLGSSPSIPTIPARVAQ